MPAKTVVRLPDSIAFDTAAGMMLKGLTAQYLLRKTLPVEGLALTKAHRRVEGSHRAAAWRMILDHVPAAEYAGVLAAMESTLEAWRTYRDAVAAACGLER